MSRVSGWRAASVWIAARNASNTRLRSCCGSGRVGAARAAATDERRPTRASWGGCSDGARDYLAARSALRVGIEQLVGEPRQIGGLGGQLGRTAPLGREQLASVAGLAGTRCRHHRAAACHQTGLYPLHADDGCNTFLETCHCQACSWQFLERLVISLS